MNGYQWRIEMAHKIFLACDGDINKAMKHGKMPYKARKTVQKLAREHKWYEEFGISKPTGAGGLEEKEIERIRKAFIEAGGHTRKTAQLTDFGTSTVSRYATKRGWREQMLQTVAKATDQQTERRASIDGLILSDQNDVETTQEESKENEKEIVVKLRTLRKFLLDEIVGDGNPETTSRPLLKIPPKTLSEAVKALLDVDKRICEREGSHPDKILGTYQSILANCAKITEGESE